MRSVGGDSRAQLSMDEKVLVLEFAKCNLNLSPKHNWV
jgi:hypothetical protein